MSNDAEFCAARAAEARREAEQTNLARVREQQLRAAEIWEDMARHAFKSAELRQEREQAVRKRTQSDRADLDLARP